MKPLRSLAFLATAVVLLAWFFVFRPGSLAGPASYVVVTGQSMEPTLHSGDFVFAHKQSSYAPGDVIAYHAQQGGASGTVIHRIVGGDGEAGFQVKGDNKDLPDPWTPKQSEVLGKQWLSVPGGGHLVKTVSEPRNLAILVIVIAGFSLLGERKVRGGRRKSKGNIMVNSNKNSGSSTSPPPWAVAALGVSAILTLAIGFQTFRALREPDSKVLSVERAKIEQTVAFDYTFFGAPSTLYPTGVVGPILSTQSEADDGKVDPVPFYAKQAPSIRLGLSYALKSDQQATVQGETSAELLIKASGDDGWSKTQPLMDSKPFSGTSTRAEMNVDLTPIQGLIDKIEKETGFQPSYYDIAVLVTVGIRGTVGEQQIDETFTPAFTIKYQRTSLTPDANLLRSKPATFSELVTQRQEALFGLPVSTACILGLSLTLITVGFTALFASVVFLGIGLDEAAKMQARYGTRMIAVREANDAGLNRVQVARLADLAALAGRYDRMVFKQHLDTGERYFVPDGDVTYEFTSSR